MALPSTTPPEWPDRVRLVGVDLDVDPGGSARVTVSLALPGSPDGALDGVGTGWGLGHREGLMRASSAATIEALEALGEGRIRLELRGIRAFRAFDTHLVAVSVTARADGDEYRLIGSVGAPGGDLVRGTAMAVLDAVNRVIHRHILSTDSRT